MTEDRRWLEQAIALGALGEGTRPNPRVGCLLVRDGRVVGRGYHRAPGLPHAEAVAVAEAADAARGATVYVNLEPCAHHGRTPPCTDLLVRAGVRRVVASIRDPNPLVNGLGFDALRAAGIEVDVGLLAEQAERINEPFLHWHRSGRPMVTIKAALSLDGRIAARDGQSRWISGPASRRFAHRLRLRHDAVLVGAETVRRDDPRLTVRLGEEVGVPLRAVIAPELNLDPDAALFAPGSRKDDGVRVYVDEGLDPSIESGFAGRARIVRVRRRQDGLLDLRAVLDDLAGVGVQSVLVEGGGRTIGGFIESGLADRAALFVAGSLLGARGSTPLADLAAVSRPSEGWRLTGAEQLAVGPDQLLYGKLAPAADAG